MNIFRLKNNIILKKFGKNGNSIHVRKKILLIIKVSLYEIWKFVMLSLHRKFSENMFITEYGRDNINYGIYYNAIFILDSELDLNFNWIRHSKYYTRVTHYSSLWER